MLGERFQIAGGYNGEKTSICRQLDPRIYVRGINRRARRFEAACAKGFDDKRIKHVSDCRPSPRLVHELRKPDLTASNPWIVQAGHHDQPVVKEYFVVNIVFQGPVDAREPELDAALAQFVINRRQTARQNVKDDAGKLPRQL